MAKKQPQPDEQRAMDIEDHNERVAQISAALAHVEKCRSVATSLKLQLRQAKRQLEEAEWEANSRIRQMAERAKRKSPPSDSQPNGTA